MSGRKRRRQPLGQSIGGVLFGFEQQVWRNQPPPHELVHHARPDDPLPAGDGTFLAIAMPPEAGAGRRASLGRAPGPGAGDAGGGAQVIEPELRDLDATHAVTVRVVVPMADADIGGLVGRHLPAMARGTIPSLGLGIAGPPFVRYHAWGGDTADIELGFPVDGKPGGHGAGGDDRLGEPAAVVLPGGPALVLVHVGPYPDLPTTWGRMDDALAERGLVAAGAPWESYVDNPDLVDPARLRTEVIQPVSRPG
jgi:effector-binding domain-containing protein